MYIYKFSDTASENCPEVTQEQLIQQLKDGNQFTFGNWELMKHGTYKLGGWAFDIREHLNRYVYLQYGSWSEIWAPNKTSVRKLVYGRIDKIMEVK